MNSQHQNSIPNLYHAKNILGVQPHYDDNDLGAGGTIAALHARGATIAYLTVTNDLVGVIDPLLPDDIAVARLKAEQETAGAIIGVSEQYRLGYPDAGQYDYFELRRNIIKHIRYLRPDFVFTVDPWLPYEAHNDHRQVGMATAEAVYLQQFVRLPSDPEIDCTYEPYEITGIVFYHTHTPNLIFDITEYADIKHQAIDVYRTQFSAEDMARLHQWVEALDRDQAKGRDFLQAEALRVLKPDQLHGLRAVQLANLSTR